MFPDIDTKLPPAVEGEVLAVYQAMFPGGDRGFVRKVFAWASDCFGGRYQDFLPIDARYHDFEHTMQGTLCFVRLLQGRHADSSRPALPQREFELGLLAILLHDTGYLKRRDDHDGTGAKYTSIHVNRSCEFAQALLAGNGFEPSEIRSVQNMIRCTGVNVDLQRVPFQNEFERIVGFALGTADLLGQMAADDYVGKLPVLYAEFEESARFNLGGSAAPALFSSARDLMEKTPSFWERYVLPKITRDFDGLYKYLSSPFPDGPNFYVEKIEANIALLRAELLAAPVA